MEYFISDTHFGHYNCIKLNGRPFDSLESMDNAMLENWNDRVKNSDTVYILGDLIHKSSDPERYLKKLNGKKILVCGNHDFGWLERLGFAERKNLGVVFSGYSRYFKHISQFLETTVNNIAVTMCHYPMLEWRACRKLGSRKLGFLIHGHIHNNRSAKYYPLFAMPHALNASADINGLAPVTFAELVKNNEAFAMDVLRPVDRARYLSEKYHMYQTDKSGRPYIEHPATVAGMLESDDEKCVGYMHDLLEDTDIDEQIIRANFSDDVFAAVKAMTHADGEDYFDYIARIAQNPLATRVKLADLTHNMDMSRLSSVTDADISRREKYQKAYLLLLKKK